MIYRLGKDGDVMKNRIYDAIQNFFSYLIENPSIEIYNEFSLQHEMGLYFRSIFPDYKIQFERNTKFFNISNLIKKEIDIVIYNDIDRYAIELKYPLNGQYPEQMYSFVKDIKFMEELKENNFINTFCVTLVRDKNFYQGANTNGIYSYFRAGKSLSGIIEKPTGAIRDTVNINGIYLVSWNDFKDEKYYIISI